MAVLPKLKIPIKEPNLYDQFISELMLKGFKGDIQTDQASRLLAATDNSVYQVIPEVVLFPKDHDDIVLIFSQASRAQFRSIKFSPRGGGTGTNGQSLSPGIIIDHSRYFNQIGKLNIDEGWVEVEPGVVLDQLNQFLKPHNVFFAPSLSPSDRATLGGMCNTDACGKGSYYYGRTSDHLIELTGVLVDGTVMTTHAVDISELAEIKDQSGKVGNIYQTIDDILVNHKDEIERVFPKLQRFMTGYNLAKVYDENRKNFNLNYLLSGSEGTLAYITKLKLKLTPIPKYKALFAIAYSSFDRALRAARELLEFQPVAIETLDDMILTLAAEDESYHKIKPLLFRDQSDQIIPRGLNLIEFMTDSVENLDQLIIQVTDKLEKIQKNDHQLKSFFATKETSEIDLLWDLRKKSVGLLANLEGKYKPVPFMEDTVVSPEYLADFILELRKLLDSYGLRYGMFGHVDVGCLHMRPALDMTNRNDQKKLVEITYKVSQLVRQYGGVYWSEHGKGFRSELVKDYFGEILTKDLAKIKKAFDPYNQLNPGKISIPEGSNESLVKIDGPFRGRQEQLISDQAKNQWGNIFSCNGNARCLNRDFDFTMCPSAKVSDNWVYSPKGRANLIREWSYQLAKKSYDCFSPKPYLFFSHLIKPFRYGKNHDFSYEVHQSMQKCLGCKACQTSCPVQVDIAQHKPLFLHHYHSRYQRPLKDYIIGGIESFSKISVKLPRLYNAISQNSLSRYFIQSSLKLVDLPKLSHIKFSQALKKRNAAKFSLVELQSLSEDQKKQSVCLVQDAFSSFYDVDVALNIYDALTKLGFDVYVLPFKPSGKSLHVKGFLTKFKQLALKNSSFYHEIAKTGVPLVGVEPTLTLCYRDEYVKTLGKDKVNFEIKLPQEFLLENIHQIKKDSLAVLSDKPYYLFSHCSERSVVLTSAQQWQQLFEHFGAKLEVIELGCCGMAGTYGHELENKADSHKIYQNSWQKRINSLDKSRILATGFSCRSQVKRFSYFEIKHPLSILV
ncbi:FAD-binding oxidoreductase [Thiotrichales bacterium 19S9-12]|nr:FAD-binding oxidoreductase [Thiotrichales bacterium 19S9-11]MCF6811273.1 FAD-binding oxidoreductase [Thiotrichales bacterium 19S9-12]